MASRLRKIYRRLRYGRPIIIVSGLPRSGTSMAMKMLGAGGLPLIVDGVRTADEDNPKGYFEFERVKDMAGEQEWSWLDDSRGKGIKIISYLLKELPANHNYKVLLMRRDLKEILASQSKMLDRRGEISDTDEERMIELFESDLWKTSYLLKHNPQFEALEIHYRDVLARPLDQAQRIRDFLEVDLPVEKMAQVVDPDLYRNRAEVLGS
jgi:hypothetical protein